MKDSVLIEKANEALENGAPIPFDKEITNLNRACGAMISYEISKRYGKEGMPDDTIQIKMEGHAG